MITDEQFSKYIGELSDADELVRMLVKFRDTACMALRDSHTQKNFNQN